MTKKKKITLLLGLVSLVFTINLVESTYAKYVTKVDTKENINVSRWDIVVNNERITKKETLTGVLTPTYESNSNVAENVIAPGSKGYFDVEIDSSNTDVNFNYTIEIKPASSSSVTDIKLLKYKINDEDEVNITDNSSKFTGEVKKDDTNKKTKLRIYVIWYDSLGETMDNESDTNVGYESTKESTYGDINVNMTFEQKN